MHRVVGPYVIKRRSEMETAFHSAFADYFQPLGVEVRWLNYTIRPATNFGEAPCKLWWNMQYRDGMPPIRRWTRFPEFRMLQQRSISACTSTRHCLLMPPVMLLAGLCPLAHCHFCTMQQLQKSRAGPAEVSHVG